MLKEYELEEVADLAIKEIRKFVNLERQIVKNGHDLFSRMDSLHLIIGHLDERMPSNWTKLHDLSGQISVLIINIMNSIKYGSLKGIEITREKEYLELSRKVRHRNWVAVRNSLKSEIEREESTTRLEIKQLKTLHGKFISLMRLMKAYLGELMSSQDFASIIKKDRFVKLHHYYFTVLYKFARAYERIFRHLWRKERNVLGKLEEDYETIR
ncbi:MAG TPA: hypothetical protein VI564_03225 [Candidatus Nanoarchaeia archaeon]|nr:hypothetical protein [Candidatus Nanoarchaeia archaeon]